MQELEFHQGKLPDKTYLSRSFHESEFDQPLRRMRYISKVFDSDGRDECVVEANEVIIRRTDGGRQEIKALFYEDDRSIQRLILTRFMTKSGKPTRNQLSFDGEEVDKIVRLLSAIPRLQLDHDDKLRLDDEFVDQLFEEDETLLAYLERNKHRLAQLDTAPLWKFLEYEQRCSQLKTFERLLSDPEHFSTIQAEWGCRGAEAVWQRFLEQSPWIFGVGLAPMFVDSLSPDKLEQIVAGNTAFSSGKRADALLKTRGRLSSICFAEIKTHRTPLLSPAPYRPDVWRVSDEVSGAVSQCQRTVQRAIEDLDTRLHLTDDDGNPLPGESFLYHPRTYLVVGTLDQFSTRYGPNVSKFSSFELYRRHLHAPEIITFDELLERAKATVDLQK